MNIQYERYWKASFKILKMASVLKMWIYDNYARHYKMNLKTITKKWTKNLKIKIMRLHVSTKAFSGVS